MQSSTVVGKIYADALFTLAKAANKIDVCYTDMQEIDAIIKNSKEFKNFFISPVIERKLKTKIIRDMLENKIDGLVLNLLCVLIKKNRESAIENIFTAFSKYRDTSENRIYAQTISAKKLSDDLLEKIKKQLADHLNKNVILDEKINELLIGGLIIRVGDNIIDGSVRNKLRRLKHDFETMQKLSI